MIAIVTLYERASCARGDTICTVHCTPDAAAQLQPIPYACGAQRALLPIDVGSMDINELMNMKRCTRVHHNIPTPLRVDL